MPSVLGSGFTEQWRTWAYNARDWVTNSDLSMSLKLEEVESRTTELTDDGIITLAIPEETNILLKRLLVHD